MHDSESAILEFELWGSGNPKFSILTDGTVQKILLAIRTTAKNCERIADEICVDVSEAARASRYHEPYRQGSAACSCIFSCIK
mgnify:CR=1 FL=1